MGRGGACLMRGSSVPCCPEPVEPAQVAIGSQAYASLNSCASVSITYHSSRSIRCRTRNKNENNHVFRAQEEFQLEQRRQDQIPPTVWIGLTNPRSLLPRLSASELEIVLFFCGIRSYTQAFDIDHATLKRTGRTN